MPSTIKIALLGTGAIGASVARALYLNQVPFTILVRDKRRKADLTAKGIAYRTKSLTHVRIGDGVKVQTLAEAQQKARSLKFDYIFLGMKTPHLRVAASTAKKLLAKNGRIVLLQNGLPENAVTSLKPEQIISGIVGYNTQLLGSGEYYQSNPGHLILASPLELPGDLAQALEPHLPIVVSHNALGYRWNKLAINSVINGLGAVTGLALGPLFLKRHARRVAIGLIKEAAAVMRALNIEEGVVPGAISVYRFAKLPGILQHTMLIVLGQKYAKIRTSMLQDVERGVKTEVNEIHGAIVAAAEKKLVPVPLTAAILRRVHQLELGPVTPSTDALKEIV
jgi:2-dehydropantoate 2-reductase